MLGSILSNLLFILGTSFFFGEQILSHIVSATLILVKLKGGLKHNELKYKETGAHSYVLVLELSSYLRNQMLTRLPYHSLSSVR